MPERTVDIAIIGGGVGACAAAMAATALGRRVVVTEESAWLGGQLTAQAVPPDEHPWIESFGCTRRYRRFRELVRAHYREHYPLTSSARFDPSLNPGLGGVSRLCCEPRAALAALNGMLAYPRSAGLLEVLHGFRPVAAAVAGDRVQAVTVRSHDAGRDETIHADWFLDATELGDLLALTDTEYVLGAEGQADTGEPHAPEEADCYNVQGITWCFAVSHDAGSHRVIDRPAHYAFWRDYVPGLVPEWTGKLLDWTFPSPISLQPRPMVLFPEERAEGAGDMWTYRRIACRAHYADGQMPLETTLVNWPQNDYFLRSLIDRPDKEVKLALDEARQLSLSLLYWMQTEAPRPDGGSGYPGLFPRPDITGAEHGLAMSPYIRESRRIRAVLTVAEQHVGVDARASLGATGPENFEDSVGVGCYRIDLHPSTGGDNYIDISAYPFQIPLGALLPVRMRNLLPACKNLGVTHITNGCYRLHPVEWNIGEAAGMLAAFCMGRGAAAHQVRENEPLLLEFQALLRAQGVELEWPRTRAV
jgi:hypothetical protein